MIRPGPPAIDPGGAPGGIVFHVYDLAGVLLLTRRVGSQMGAELERLADLDADTAAGHGDVVLVCYDGDTGERVIPPGYYAGDVVS